jgi:hypothetical protein
MARTIPGHSGSSANDVYHLSKSNLDNSKITSRHLSSVATDFTGC